jgi:hypothetical protein
MEAQGQVTALLTQTRLWAFPFFSRETSNCCSCLEYSLRTIVQSSAGMACAGLYIVPHTIKQLNATGFVDPAHRLCLSCMTLLRE